MKKGFFLSIVLSASLFGGDYGYRDYLTDRKNEFIALDETSTVSTNYMPADYDVRQYCLIQGGNFYGVLTTDLGTEAIPAYNEADLAPIRAMSMEQRKELSLKKELKPGMTKTYLGTLYGSNYQGKHALSVPYECKAADGNIIFKAKVAGGVENLDHWIVEHKPEPVIDYVNLHVQADHKDSNMLSVTRWEGPSVVVQKELSAKYPTYEAYFDDWNTGFTSKGKNQKLNGNYRLRDSFGFDNKFWLGNSMAELIEVQYFCESKKGLFLKDGKPFRSFLKNFYFNGGRAVDYVTSPFQGNYGCINIPDAFSIELSGFKSATNLGFTLDYALIKKGAPAQSVQQPAAQAPVTPIQQPKQATAPIVQSTVAAPQLQPQNQMAAMQQMFAGMLGNGGMKGATQPAMQNPNKEAMFAKMGINMSDMNLVTNAVASKAPFGTQQGANVSTALYNGKDAQGCDLVAIEKSVANIPNSKQTYNYKACNGQITALGETGMPGVPRAKELNPIIAQVKNQCKAYGAYGSEYQGTVVSCRTLDQNHCNLEITIMQNGMMVDKQLEDSCK
jgi:hypothetical protein